MCYFNCTITVIFSLIRLDECSEITLEKCAEEENYKPELKKLISKSESSNNDQVAESIELESNTAPEKMMNRLKLQSTSDNKNKNSEKKLRDMFQFLNECRMPYEKYPERCAEDWVITQFISLVIIAYHLSTESDCELFRLLFRWTELKQDTNESKEEQRSAEPEVHKQPSEMYCEKSNSVSSKNHSSSSFETYKEDKGCSIDEILRFGSSKFDKKIFDEETEFIVLSELYPSLVQISQKIKDREKSSQLIERTSDVESADESINNIPSPSDSNMSDNLTDGDGSMDSLISDTDTRREAFNLVNLGHVLKLIESRKKKVGKVDKVSPNSINLKEEITEPPDAPRNKKGKKRKKQSCDFISENASPIFDYENVGQISEIEDSFDQKVGIDETSLDEMSHSMNSKDEVEAPRNKKGNKRKKQFCDFISDNISNFQIHSDSKRLILNNENSGQMEDSDDQNMINVDIDLDNGINLKDDLLEVTEAPMIKKGNKGKKKTCDYNSENDSHVSNHTLYIAPKKQILGNENTEQFSGMKDSYDQNIGKAETNLDKMSNINSKKEVSELVQESRNIKRNKRKKKSCDFISENSSPITVKRLILNKECIEQVQTDDSGDQNLIEVDTNLENASNSINLKYDFVEPPKPPTTQKRDNENLGNFYGFISKNKTCVVSYLDEFINNEPSPCDSKVSENLMVDDVSIDSRISNCTGTKRKTFSVENIEEISEMDESNKSNIGEMDTYLNKVSDSNSLKDVILELTEAPHNEERSKRKRKSCGFISENGSHIPDLIVSKRPSLDANNVGKKSKIEEPVDDNISIIDRLDERSNANVNSKQDVTELEPEVSKNNTCHKRKTNFCEFSSVFFDTYDNAAISSEDMRLFEAASGKTTRDYLQDGYLKHRPKKSKMYCEDVPDIPYLTDITENHYQMHNRDDKSASCNEYRGIQKETEWITDWDKFEVSGFRKGAFSRRANRYNNEFALQPDRNKNKINYEKMENQICEKITSDYLSAATYSDNGAIENSAIENSANENSSIENSAIENTAIENGAIENTAIENGAIENSAIENSANENSSIENSAIENSAIENGAIENSAIDNSAVENTAIENGAIENTAIENTAIEYGAIENSAIENGAIENGAIENGAIENGAIENGAIENGATENSAIENVAIENDAIENSATCEPKSVYDKVEPVIELEEAEELASNCFSDAINIDNETVPQLDVLEDGPEISLDLPKDSKEFACDEESNESNNIVLCEKTGDLLSRKLISLRLSNISPSIKESECELNCGKNKVDNSNDQTLHKDVSVVISSESIDLERSESCSDTKLLAFSGKSDNLAPGLLADTPEGLENGAKVLDNVIESKDLVTHENCDDNKLEKIFEKPERSTTNIFSDIQTIGCSRNTENSQNESILQLNNCDSSSPTRIELREESKVGNQALECITLSKEAEVLAPDNLSEEGNNHENVTENSQKESILQQLNCDIAPPEIIELTEDSKKDHQANNRSDDLSEEGNNPENANENSQKEYILPHTNYDIASPERIELTEESQMVNQALESINLLEKAEALVPVDLSQVGKNYENANENRQNELIVESQMVNQVLESMIMLQEAEIFAPNDLSEEGNNHENVAENNQKEYILQQTNCDISSPARIELTEESKVDNQALEAETLAPKDLSEEGNNFENAIENSKKESILQQTNCDNTFPEIIELTEERQVVNQLVEANALLKIAEVLAPNDLSQEGNNRENYIENSQKESPILQQPNCDITSPEIIELTEENKMVNQVSEGILAPKFGTEEGKNHENVNANSQKETILQQTNCDITSPEIIELTKESQMVNQALEYISLVKEAEEGNKHGNVPEKGQKESFLQHTNYFISSPARIELTEESQFNQVLEAEILAPKVLSEEGKNPENSIENSQKVSILQQTNCDITSPERIKLTEESQIHQALECITLLKEAEVLAPNDLSEEGNNQENNNDETGASQLGVVINIISVEMFSNHQGPNKIHQELGDFVDTTNNSEMSVRSIDSNIIHEEIEFISPYDLTPNHSSATISSPESHHGEINLLLEGTDATYPEIKCKDVMNESEVSIDLSPIEVISNDQIDEQTKDNTSLLMDAEIIIHPETEQKVSSRDLEKLPSESLSDKLIEEDDLCFKIKDYSHFTEIQNSLPEIDLKAQPNCLPFGYLSTTDSNGKKNLENICRHLEALSPLESNIIMSSKFKNNLQKSPCDNPTALSSVMTSPVNCNAIKEKPRTDQNYKESIKQTSETAFERRDTLNYSSETSLLEFEKLSFKIETPSKCKQVAPSPSHLLQNGFDEAVKPPKDTTLLANIRHDNSVSSITKTEARKCASKPAIGLKNIRSSCEDKEIPPVIRSGINKSVINADGILNRKLIFVEVPEDLSGRFTDSGLSSLENEISDTSTEYIPTAKIVDEVIAYSFSERGTVNVEDIRKENDIQIDTEGSPPSNACQLFLLKTSNASENNVENLLSEKVSQVGTNDLKSNNISVDEIINAQSDDSERAPDQSTNSLEQSSPQVSADCQKSANLSEVSFSSAEIADNSIYLRSKDINSKPILDTNLYHGQMCNIFEHSNDNSKFAVNKSKSLENSIRRSILENRIMLKTDSLCTKLFQSRMNDTNDIETTNKCEESLMQTKPKAKDSFLGERVKCHKQILNKKYSSQVHSKTNIVGEPIAALPENLEIALEHKPDEKEIDKSQDKEDIKNSLNLHVGNDDNKDIEPTNKCEESLMQAKTKAKTSLLDKSAKCHTQILHRKDSSQVHTKTNIIGESNAALPENLEISLEHRAGEIEKSQNKVDIENETLLEKQSKYNSKDLSEDRLSCDNVVNLETQEKQPNSKSRHMNSHETYQLLQNKEREIYISNEKKNIVSKLNKLQDDIIDQCISRLKLNLVAEPLNLISNQNAPVMGDKSQADIIDPFPGIGTFSTSCSSGSDKHDKDVTYQVKVINDLKLSIIRKRGIHTYIDNNFKIESEIFENDDNLCQQNAISPVLNNKEDCKHKASSNEVLDSSLLGDEFGKLPKESKVKPRCKADHNKSAALTKIYARKPNIIQDKINKTEFAFAELEINKVTKDNNIKSTTSFEKNCLTTLTVLCIIFQNIAGDLRQNSFQKSDVYELSNLGKKIRVFVDDKNNVHESSKEICDIFDKVKNIGKKICQTIRAAVGKNRKRKSNIVKGEGTINNKKIINNFSRQLGIRNCSHPSESNKSGSLEINTNQNEDSSTQKKDPEKPDLVQGPVPPDLLNRLPEHNPGSSELTDTSGQKLGKKIQTSGSKRPNDHQIKIMTAKRYKQCGQPEIPPWQRRRHAKFTDPVVEVEICNTKEPKIPSKTQMRHDHIDVKPVMPRKLALRNRKLSKKTSSEENTNTSERSEIITGNSAEVADTDVSQHVETSDISKSVVLDTVTHETNTEIQNSVSEENKVIDSIETEKEKPSSQINQATTGEIIEEPVTNAVLSDLGQDVEESDNSKEIPNEIHKINCEQSDSNLNKCNEKEMKKSRMDLIISIISEHREETVTKNNKNETESVTNIIATTALKETAPAYPQNPLELTSTSSNPEEITTPNKTPSFVQNVKTEDSTLAHEQQNQHLAQLSVGNEDYEQSLVRLFEAYNLRQRETYNQCLQELSASNKLPRGYGVADANRHLDNVYNLRNPTKIAGNDFPAAPTDLAPRSMINVNGEPQTEQNLTAAYMEPEVTTSQSLSMSKAEKENLWARYAELMKENTPTLSQGNTSDTFGRHPHHESIESCNNHEHDQIQNGAHVGQNKELNKQNTARHNLIRQSPCSLPSNEIVYQLNAEVGPVRIQSPSSESNQVSHAIPPQIPSVDFNMNTNPSPEIDNSKSGSIRCRPTEELMDSRQDLCSPNSLLEAPSVQHGLASPAIAIPDFPLHVGQQNDPHRPYRIEVVENSQPISNEDDIRQIASQLANALPPQIRAQIRGQIGAYYDIRERNESAILQRNRKRAQEPASVSRGRSEISAKPSTPQYVNPTIDPERNRVDAPLPQIRTEFPVHPYTPYFEGERLNSNRLALRPPGTHPPFQTPVDPYSNYIGFLSQSQRFSGTYPLEFQSFPNTTQPYDHRLPLGLPVSHLTQFQNMPQFPLSLFSPTLPVAPQVTMPQSAKRTKPRKRPVRRTK